MKKDFKPNAGTTKPAVTGSQASAPKSAVKKFYNKTELVLGTGFVIAAFVCIFVIFYLFMREHQAQLAKFKALSEQAEILNIENTATREHVQALREKVGTAISLKKLVNEAEGAYGPEEKSRRTGALWIDRAAGTCYVTLGALHGLTPGAKLTIMDGENELGELRVETPMDVISYVRPINKTLADFAQDYYRVVIK